MILLKQGKIGVLTNNHQFIPYNSFNNTFSAEIDRFCSEYRQTPDRYKLGSFNFDSYSHLEEIDLALDLDKQTPGTQLAATLELAPGDKVELINVHLKRSIIRYDVWRGEAWRTHTELRIANRNRLRAIMKALPESITPQPRIIAGDFGTPYNDDIYRVLKRDYSDAFRSVGAGWGNTFPAGFPILRIDQIWNNEGLAAQSAGTVTVAHTDHRLVTAHFQITTQGGYLALR